MSHPPSIYGRNAVLGDDRSSANSSLLTPPLLPLDKHDAPFKPSSFDTISLNMKKKHKHGSHHSETTSPLATSRSTGYLAFDSQPMAKRRSMMEIHSLSTPDVSPTASPPIEEDLSIKEEPCFRRWTLPSKASSTQSVTTLRSIVRQTIWNEKRASPAMIVLRRATAKGSSRRSTGITFFPEPEFNQNQGLLASFVKTLTSESGSTARLKKPSENKMYQSGSNSSSRMRRPSVRAMAPTIQTAITIEPERFISSSLPAQSQLRRCSTRYVSGSSSYEVIWEDDDRPTMIQNGAGVSPEISPHDRRDSAAASQLERTLKRCRETSQASPAGTMFSSSDGRSSIRKSFSFVLPARSEQTLSRTVHETSLQKLPRSRTGEQLKSKHLSHLNAGLISPRRSRSERQGAKRGSGEGDAAYHDGDRQPLLSLSPDMLG